MGRTLARTGKKSASRGAWTDERVLAEGDLWFQSLKGAFRSARRRVACEMYIVASDAVGESLCGELVRAARRGCEVRLLVDGFGSAEWLRDGAGPRFLEAGGVLLRVWNPLPWMLWPRARLEKRLRWFSGLGRRDHRKLCLVDQTEAWVGSLNWVASHSRRSSGKTAWRDVGARVSGGGLLALANGFEHAWRRAWPVHRQRLRLRLRKGPRVPRTPHALVRLNDTLRLRASYRADLYARLRHARDRIWIANAYFIPGRRLVRALLAAARRGVDVRVLFPGMSDHPILSWISTVLSDRLQAAGVKVFAYGPPMLHAKTMLVDGQAVVGSHNLDERSFIHNLECEVLLQKPASIRRLEAFWKEDLAHARPLPFPAAASLPFWKRAAARVALLLRYWL